MNRILGVLGIGLGLMLWSRRKTERKEFVYRGIRVRTYKPPPDRKRWYWSAEPAEQPKSFWEWIKWPIGSGDTNFETSQDAALDALRVIDETVPFE